MARRPLHVYTLLTGLVSLVNAGSQPIVDFDSDVPTTQGFGEPSSLNDSDDLRRMLLSEPSDAEEELLDMSPESDVAASSELLDAAPQMPQMPASAPPRRLRGEATAAAWSDPAAELEEAPERLQGEALVDDWSDPAAELEDMAPKRSGAAAAAAAIPGAESSDAMLASINAQLNEVDEASRARMAKLDAQLKAVKATEAQEADAEQPEELEKLEKLEEPEPMSAIQEGNENVKAQAQAQDSEELELEEAQEAQEAQEETREEAELADEASAEELEREAQDFMEEEHEDLEELEAQEENDNSQDQEEAEQQDGEEEEAGQNEADEEDNVPRPTINSASRPAGRLTPVELAAVAAAEAREEAEVRAAEEAEVAREEAEAQTLKKQVMKAKNRAGNAAKAGQRKGRAAAGSQWSPKNGRFQGKKAQAPTKSLALLRQGSHVQRNKPAPWAPKKAKTGLGATAWWHWNPSKLTLLGAHGKADSGARPAGVPVAAGKKKLMGTKKILPVPVPPAKATGPAKVNSSAGTAGASTVSSRVSSGNLRSAAAPALTKASSPRKLPEKGASPWSPPTPRSRIQPSTSPAASLKASRGRAAAKSPTDGPKAPATSKAAATAKTPSSDKLSTSGSATLSSQPYSRLPTSVTTSSGNSSSAQAAASAATQTNFTISEAAFVRNSAKAAPAEDEWANLHEEEQEPTSFAFEDILKEAGLTPDGNAAEDDDAKAARLISELDHPFDIRAKEQAAPSEATKPVPQAIEQGSESKLLDPQQEPSQPAAPQVEIATAASEQEAVTESKQATENLNASEQAALSEDAEKPEVAGQEVAAGSIEAQVAEHAASPVESESASNQSLPQLWEGKPKADSPSSEMAVPIENTLDAGLPMTVESRPSSHWQVKAIVLGFILMFVVFGFFFTDGLSRDDKKSLEKYTVGRRGSEEKSLDGTKTDEEALDESTSEGEPEVWDVTEPGDSKQFEPHSDVLSSVEEESELQSAGHQSSDEELLTAAATPKAAHVLAKEPPVFRPAP
mmetsp:Transcript_73678/g.159438  ORF Transcript_73678/g.159438 Transcript_73678/m.159438 type:complete len:1019 (-) Transcript_73678:187-3243(-)